MRHAVLGVGGVGGLVGAALARAGQEVLLILQPPSMAVYGGSLKVRSSLIGDFEVAIPAAPRLEQEVDVLWVAVRAAQLEEALSAAPPEPLVIPLLDGIDHLACLRAVHADRVVPGTIRAECERLPDWVVVHAGQVATIELAPPAAHRERVEELAAEVRAAGLACTLYESEGRMLWARLAVALPLLLITASSRMPIGPARSDPERRRLLTECAREVCAVAATEGVGLDPEACAATLMELPDETGSSMLRDRLAGRPPELDAVAGPVLRLSRERGVPVPVIMDLVDRLGQAAQAV